MIILAMWNLFGIRKSKPPLQEASPDLLERCLLLEAKVKAIELQLDEQHDFIRRLASRRAKEEAVDRARGTPRTPTPEPDEQIEDKAALRRRGLSLLRSSGRVREPT